MAPTSNFNIKGNKIQHDFNVNVVNELEDLLHLIDRGSVKSSSKAT